MSAKSETPQAEGTVFLLGWKNIVEGGESLSGRYETPTRLTRIDIQIRLPAHLQLPEDRCENEGEILGFCLRMTNWLMRERKLGRYLDVEIFEEIPLEPFATMLKLNWPHCYKWAYWGVLIREHREELRIEQDEKGIWRLETQKGQEERIVRESNTTKPAPLRYPLQENVEGELELVTAKLAKMFSREANPNALALVRWIDGKNGEKFIAQLAQDLCQNLYGEEAARWLSAEMLLPILQQVIPTLLTEELRARARAEEKGLEAMGETGAKERKRLEEAAARPPGRPSSEAASGKIAASAAQA